MSEEIQDDFLALLDEFCDKESKPTISLEESIERDLEKVEISSNLPDDVIPYPETHINDMIGKISVEEKDLLIGINKEVIDYSKAEIIENNKFSSTPEKITKKRGRKKIKEEEVKVPVVEVKNERASINYSLGATVNIGNYESMKVQVGVTMPCDANIESIRSTYRTLEMEVEKILKEKVTELKG
ncbi:MAG: hypothetical protein EPN88_13800 [Bacteroidetes bacterium]|nr:MAG: hypothetical protein EPN88_13800 [Bacteroidota bacterium]